MLALVESNKSGPYVVGAYFVEGGDDGRGLSEYSPYLIAQVLGAVNEGAVSSYEANQLITDVIDPHSVPRVLSDSLRALSTAIDSEKLYGFVWRQQLVQSAAQGHIGALNLQHEIHAVRQGEYYGNPRVWTKEGYEASLVNGKFVPYLWPDSGRR